MGFMRPTRKPSRTDFVVRGVKSRSMQRLNEIAEQLAELDDESVVVRVKSSGGGTSKATWAKIQETLEGKAFATPVLDDTEGNEFYPTGTLHARFNSVPTDRELQRFCSEHGLELVSRNEFQPAQAAFRVRDPSAVFLPDLVEQLNREDTVKRAWEEAQTHYHRGR